ncbi:MAG TPA: AfsR/SARP family transcriptional regulator [Actinospica sp.]|nr:AfsR/SARP family transcriptional regulator [Actinospica sp.]
MDVTVLGPVSAQEQGRSVLPTAGKPRQLLALLALRADHLVTVGTLMREVWGARPPRSASTTLQTYVLQVRRLLAGADADADRAKEILQTRPGGYRLVLPAGRVDAFEFERLAGAGRRALNAGDDRTAADLLGRALDLWQGPALMDVSLGEILELEALSLEESRTSVLESRIDADLRLGRHSQLIPELRVLAARDPMNESVHRQLMLAFYRSGNAWRALEAYHALRRTLRGELGLEPSGSMRRLQHAVLTDAPELSDVRASWSVALPAAA